MRISHLLIINTYRHETFIKNYPHILGKINLVSLLIGCIALLASCHSDEGEPLSADEPRTVTLYETRSYEFLFWADQGDTYYTATDLQNIRSAAATGASMGIAYMSHYTWDGSASANITLDFAVSKITLINTTSTLWRDNTVSVTLAKAYSGISVKDGVTGTAAAYTYTQEITSDIDPDEDIATFYVLTKAGEEQDITVKCNSTTIATVTTTPDPGKYLTLSGNIGGASTEPSTGVELNVSIGEWEDVAIELDKLLTDDTRASTSLTGNGTADDPYLIRSAADLLHYGSGAYQNGYTRLETDIEVTASSWTPLFAPESGGTFDGNGHTISGTLECTVADVNSYVGLFDSGPGTIRDLNVTADLRAKGSIHDMIAMIGGIIGHSQTGTVSGCTYSGQMTVRVTITGPGLLFVGGIVGSMQNGTVSGCTFSGSIETDDSSVEEGDIYVGGIAGGNLSSSLSGNDCSRGTPSKPVGDE